MSLKDCIDTHVSWRVKDAWLAIPSCSYNSESFCHVDCSYFYECYPDPDSDFED